MAYRTLIDTATLARKLDDSDWRIFDVRHDLVNPGVGREQYAEGHIPGATFVNLDTELSGEKTGTNARMMIAIEKKIGRPTNRADWITTSLIFRS